MVPELVVLDEQVKTRSSVQGNSMTMSSIEHYSTSRVRDEPILVRAAELARMLNISLRTLWRLNSAGRLPRPLRLGTSVRWRLDEVNQWISAGCPPPPK
jgi:excisionase family DNA binding protein